MCILSVSIPPSDSNVFLPIIIIVCPVVFSLNLLNHLVVSKAYHCLFPIILFFAFATIILNISFAPFYYNSVVLNHVTSKIRLHLNCYWNFSKFNFFIIIIIYNFKIFYFKFIEVFCWIINN